MGLPGSCAERRSDTRASGSGTSLALLRPAVLDRLRRDWRWPAIRPRKLPLPANDSRSMTSATRTRLVCAHIRWNQRRSLDECLADVCRQEDLKRFACGGRASFPTPDSGAPGLRRAYSPVPLPVGYRRDLQGGSAAAGRRGPGSGNCASCSSGCRMMQASASMRSRNWWVVRLNANVSMDCREASPCFRPCRVRV